MSALSLPELRMEEQTAIPKANWFGGIYKDKPKAKNNYPAWRKSKLERLTSRISPFLHSRLYGIQFLNPYNKLTGLHVWDITDELDEYTDTRGRLNAMRGY